MSDADGTHTAVTTGGPRYDVDLLQFEKVLEIRFDPAEEESILQYPWHITMDEDGYFYVSDGHTHRIVVFDPTGHFVRNIGREGQGPGDLFSPILVQYLDGIITVPGSPYGKTTRFYRDGRLLDVITIPGAGFMPGVRPMRSPDGVLVVQESISVRNEEIQGFGSKITTISPEGDTLATVQAGPVTRAVRRNAEQRVYVQSRQVFEVRTRPTASYLHYRGGAQADYIPRRNQILVSEGTEPLITWHSLDGVVQERIRIDVPVESVTDEEREAILARLDSAITEAEAQEDPRQRELGIERARSARKIVVLPEEKAFWSWVLYDDRGYYWLRHAVPNDSGNERNRSGRYRVLSPDGEYLGNAEFPPHFRSVNVVRGYFLTFVYQTDTGERIPTVYRMRSAVPGFSFP
jgi:hypothetical protein